MREHEINNSNTFIMGWYIEESVCDDLVNYYNSESVFKEQGLSRNNKVDKDMKDSIDARIPPNTIELQDYLSELKKCSDLYYQRYNASSGSRGYSIKESINIQHYKIGGGFKLWHSERSSADPYIRDRHLVFMTYLNDVEDGGTDFLYQCLTVKAEKGLTLIWPADWTHTHKGQISNTKEKTIVTGWFSYI